MTCHEADLILNWVWHIFCIMFFPVVIYLGHRIDKKNEREGRYPKGSDF